MFFDILHVWDTNTGESPGTIPIGQGDGLSLKFSYDGNLIYLLDSADAEQVNVSLQ